MNEILGSPFDLEMLKDVNLMLMLLFSWILVIRVLSE